MEDTVAFAYTTVQPLQQEQLAAEDEGGLAGQTQDGGLEELAQAHATSSVIFRRIIDDDDRAEPSSSVTVLEDEEAEFLSLRINGDVGEQDDPRQQPVAVTPAASLKQISAVTGPLEAPWRQKGFGGARPLHSHLLELHQEIVDFCELISPQEEEHELRLAAIQRVTKVIKSIWKQSQVKVFGSFATGLYLPSSDIDVVILDSGCFNIQSGLQALAKALTREGIAGNMQVIGKARVPIVKFIEMESSISFDISFDMESGPDAAKFIKDALTAVPPLKPLCLVLKIFLQQRELNEVYTGGIGSYALLVMLLTYLQTRLSRQGFGSSHEPNTLDHNLGVLLVDFLDLYGRSLNVKDVGISCRDGGRFFKKRERGFFDSKRPFLLTVEDPQAPTNDIAKNSYNFQKVRYAFMLAHRLLVSVDLDECGTGAGLLERVVRVDEKLARRTKEAPKQQLLPTEEFDFPRSAGLAGEYKRGKKRKRAYEGKHSSSNDRSLEKKKKWKINKSARKNLGMSPAENSRASKGFSRRKQKTGKGKC